MKKKYDDQQEKEHYNYVSDEDIYCKMLENFDVDEIFSLCTQVSEKFLDNDNEMYKYFHPEDKK